MNYTRQYVLSAALIIEQYDGSLPLAAFLKQYFRQHKKFGSKDRKHIAHICYSYYRLGHTLKEISFAERTKLALFLCHEQAAVWQELFEPGWLEQWEPALAKRFDFVKQQFPSFSVTDIFPWKHRLNHNTVDYDRFCASHLIQPDLFLRLRLGKTTVVKQKLETAAIAYKNVSEDCIALPNGSNINDVLVPDLEAVVQDYSSQRVAELMKLVPQRSSMHIWDCCAASGGKSILAYDSIHPIELTVSDIRESIILNLRKRFERAGIHAHKIFRADMSVQPSHLLPQFDLVICDVPCTGSGTWGRTPEQLFFFNEKKIEEYATLQKKIVAHVLAYIKPGGYLLYSTCSVFSDENENIVKILSSQMETIEMKWLNGYETKADSMFAALLRKQV